MSVQQTKEEREAKTEKVYLGNVKVVWSNGDNVAPAPRDGMAAQGNVVTNKVEEDLPF